MAVILEVKEGPLFRYLSVPLLGVSSRNCRIGPHLAVARQRSIRLILTCWSVKNSKQCKNIVIQYGMFKIVPQLCTFCQTFSYTGGRCQLSYFKQNFILFFINEIHSLLGFRRLHTCRVPLTRYSKNNLKKIIICCSHVNAFFVQTKNVPSTE